jgi:1-acyl-sn-glycerol-3-phosphate acyltransferase
MSGPRLRLPTVPYGAFRALIGLLLRSEVTLIGAAHIPDGPCLAVSNHPNREEILLGYRIFRRPVRIVVQPGLMDADFLAAEIDQALAGQYRFPRFVRRLGPLLADWIARQNRRLGCIPVVREKDAPAGMVANRSALRLALEALERGEVVGMSGEGGLSPEAGVGRVERGAAAIAVHAARRGRPVPVLPIIFHGMRRLEHSLLGRGRLVVALGPVLKPELQPGETAGVAQERFRQRLQEVLEEMWRGVVALEDPAPARRRRPYGETDPEASAGGGSTMPDPSGRTTSRRPASYRA